MKRFIVLLVLPMLACSGLNAPLPPTPTSVSPTETSVPLTVIPDTAVPTQISSTDTPTSIPDTTTFPNPDAYAWQPVVSGLQRPVDLQADGSGRLFVIEKSGRIRIIQDGQLLEASFLDITDRVNDSSNEMGFLGLAFHPNYAQNGFFYVNYTGSGGNTFISRFQASGDVADPNSEEILLTVEQPFPNHNGGVVIFGPDGFLYAGLGDGGSQGDPFGNAQNTGVLLGKILRLDVDNGEPYAIPTDNPFGNEVWAYGLRNPWRISFDKLTGDLYIGDVGQNTWEEIDFLPAGSAGGTNSGWDFREGAHEYSGTAPSGLVDPVAEYSHSEGGCSVTGGYIYRGSMPEWNGIYLFGDYCTGFIWGLIRSGGGWQKQLLFNADVTITSFGQDKSGEIYLVSDNGGVYRLVQK
jgi:glucose/arabinose dehydrogenase